MPGSEPRNFEWVLRNAVPFTRLLRETENACVDRITKALFTKTQSIERIQTAAWLSMRSWRDEIAPLYKKVMSVP